jgi:hypothetical protein
MWPIWILTGLTALVVAGQDTKAKSTPPIRLEVSAAKGVQPEEECCGEEEKAGKALKIIARADWRYESARPDGPKTGRQLVIRSAAELVAATPFSRLDAPQEVVERMAGAELAKALKVDRIDWQKQMLVAVTAGVKSTGGWTVEIVSVRAADKIAAVHSKVNAPKGAVTTAFTHPGQVALVERFDGKIVFAAAEPAKAKQETKKPAAAPGEVKVLARSSAGILPKVSGHQVIRNGNELAKALGGIEDKAAAARVVAALKGPELDWQRHTLLVISGGVQRTGGYAVELQGLEVKDKVLVVRWKLKRPGPGDIVTQAITHPTLILMVNRFDGEVRFDPPAPGKGERLKERGK